MLLPVIGILHYKKHQKREASMPKKSSRKKKNIYLETRESLDLTRAEASELTGISESRIEKIESEKVLPYPEDILSMASAYKSPSLCNHFCSADCPIGQKYVSPIKEKTLSEIVVEMLSLLNTLNRKKERLIDIAADGNIDDSELNEFAQIQKDLEKIAESTDSLRLWIDQKILSGSL